MNRRHFFTKLTVAKLALSVPDRTHEVSPLKHLIRTDLSRLTSVTISAKKKLYAPLEPVVLSIVILNLSKIKTFGFHVWNNLNDNVSKTFSLQCIDQKGVSVQHTTYYKSLAEGDGNLVILLPGGSHKTEMTANLVRDMTSIGFYEIQLTAHFTTHQCISNTIMLEVNFMPNNFDIKF